MEISQAALTRALSLSKEAALSIMLRGPMKIRQRKQEPVFEKEILFPLFSKKIVPEPMEHRYIKFQRMVSKDLGHGTVQPGQVSKN